MKTNLFNKIVDKKIENMLITHSDIQNGAVYLCEGLSTYLKPHRLAFSTKI